MKASQMLLIVLLLLCPGSEVPRRGLAQSEKPPRRYEEKKIAAPDGNGVLALAFIGNSGRAISSNSAGIASIWDLASQKRQSRFAGSAFRFQDIALSPDGRNALTPAPEARVRLWDLYTGRDVRTLEGLGNPTFVAFSDDGSLAAATGVNSGIHVWSATSGKFLRAFETQTLVSHIAFDKDNTLVSVQNNGYICRWHLDVPSTPACNVAFGDPNTLASFSADGRLALFVDQYGAATLWSVAAAAALHTFVFAPGITEQALSPDGKLALYGTPDGTVKLCNLQTGRRLTELVKPGHKPLTSAAISADNTQILLGFEDGAVSVWRLSASGAR